MNDKREAWRRNSLTYLAKPGNRAKRNAANKRYRQTDAGRRKRKDGELRRNYGISIEQYEAMLVEQSGVCAICKEPEKNKDRNGKVRPLCPDHDHVSGKVRELLCDGCNVGLGRFKDSAALLLAAAKYLEKHDGK